MMSSSRQSNSILHRGGLLLNNALQRRSGSRRVGTIGIGIQPKNDKLVFNFSPASSSNNVNCTKNSIQSRRISSGTTAAHQHQKQQHQKQQHQKQSQSKPPTLFSLPNLSHPSDFIQLANAAIRDCDAVRKSLAHSLATNTTTTAPDNYNDERISISISIQRAKTTLHNLDDISNIVCTVIDAAELCRSVHACPQWRRGASDAFGILSDYIGSLNADDRLYLSLVRFVFGEDHHRRGTKSNDNNYNHNHNTHDHTTMVKKNDDNNNNNNGGSSSSSSWILASLPPEYQRMARAMRKEFERDGIHLSYDRREEARELQNVVVGLESLFSSNITEKVKYYEIGGAGMAEEVHRIVPRHILGRLVRSPPTSSSSSSPSSSSSVTLSSDTLLTNTLLAHSPSSALRKEVYLQSNTSVPENLDVLDSLIRHRHLHSSLLGYPSYAHRVLSDRMVGSPEGVMEFLDGMGGRSEDLYGKEMELMVRAKRYVEGADGGGGGGSAIEPWDVPFYTTFLKTQRQHQRWQEGLDGDDGGGGGDGEDADESSQYSGYFTVENSVEGMKVLVKELFGIAMKEVDIPMEERWDIDTTTTQQQYGNVDDPSARGNNGGLRKFEFHHEEDGPLGTMYFDLHPREGKFLHAAHFTIRCGRIRDGDDPAAEDEKNDSHNHQLPIVALVCNLSPSSSSTSSSSHAVLSHSEVETLYHEFGHGLHSLLSRTSFQHLSGTRAAMDFVETPSHLFETFTRDPSFLSRVLARHYITGVPMSERRARHLAISHGDFRGIEVQTQIVHSKFDQALFGENPCSPSLGGCTSTEMFRRLHREAGVPYAEGTHWHSRFGHLVTYGAGYYGYLYAQTFAADIWMSCLATRFASKSSWSPSSSLEVREGGMKVWKEMLIHGGAKDPKDMLVAVLGREPSVDPFFKGMS